jgi:uncharacterized protein YcbK (DUF882 family)
LLEQFCGFLRLHPNVWQGESCGFKGSLEGMTKEDFCLEKFITHIVSLMGDLSKNFSRLEIMCPCSCGADKISPVLIEKLQKVRNIIGRPIIITSGVRCEFYNASLKNSSMNSSHIPDSYGLGQAVDISCTTSKHRYELIQVAQKFFNRVGISGGSYGGFVHLDVDRSKVQEVMWLY